MNAGRLCIIIGDETGQRKNLGPPDLGPWIGIVALDLAIGFEQRFDMFQNYLLKALVTCRRPSACRDAMSCFNAGEGETCHAYRRYDNRTDSR